MTTTETAMDAPARVLSARTRAAYASDWALFTDHCAVTDRQPLPAEPQTVIEFLSACPAAPATRRRRVAAIDHHHAGAGYPKPGESVAVRAALGRPTGEPFQPTESDREAMDAALRRLPSHGWTAGMFGRRDRCLLVLSQLAGVPYRHLARLTTGDIYIADGVVTIRSAAGDWTIGAADDGLLCGPCAVVRWLKILDLAVTKPSTKTIARALKRTKAVDHRSPHVCDTAPILDDSTKVVPLLPPIDQWGACPSRCKGCRRTRCPAASAICSRVTSARTATYPSTPTRNRRRSPRWKAHRSSRWPAMPTTGRTPLQPGNADARNYRTWPGSSTCSPTSSGGPTS